MRKDLGPLVAFLKQRFNRIFIDPQRAANYSQELLDKRLKNESAILILLDKREDDWYTFFTVRSTDLRLHAGEVSFPGGHREAQDKSCIDTALRECHEETGLDPKKVEIVGVLSPLISAHQILIHPVIGLLKSEEFIPNLNASEVQRTFWTPVGAFLDKNCYVRGFAVCGILMHLFKYKEEEISGLTANLITAISMLIHSKFTPFDFGTKILRNELNVEDTVYQYFQECYNLINQFGPPQKTNNGDSEKKIQSGI